MALNSKKSQRRAKGAKPYIKPSVQATAKKIDDLKKKTSRVKRARKSPRLYMRAVHAGFKGGLHLSRNHTALLRIDNVATKQDAQWYAGKRCCYVYHGYKAKRCVRWNAAKARRSNTRAIWGRVMKPHGNSGTVKAKFNSNLPGQALGKSIRVYLYPSHI